MGGEHDDRRLSRSRDAILAHDGRRCSARPSGGGPHAERGMTRHHTLGFAAAAAFMMIQPANAIDTMESIGAEKCGRAAKAYEIDFLAPDNATVEAKAKAVVKGATDARPEAATLSLDGKECTNSRCGFEAERADLSPLSEDRHDELGRTLHRRSSPMTRRPPGEGRHHRGRLSNGRD